MMAPPGYPKTTSTLSATRASQIVCAPVLFIGIAFSERGKKRAPRPFGAGLVLAGIFLGQNGGPHPSLRRPRRLRLIRTRAPASAAETTSTLRGLRSIPYRCRAEWRDVSSSLLYFTEISRFVPGERSSSGVQDRLRDLRDSLPMGALCEHDGAGTSHPPSVGLHYRKICADQRREVGLVDHEEVRQRDPGPALARHLVPSGDVDHIDGVVGELAAVLRGEVVAAALDEEKLGGGPHLLHQLFESEEVVADVLANGGVRAAAGLDGADPCFGQRLVAHQELGVLAGEDVVRHHSQGDPIPQLATEGEEERGLAASDGSADADRERPQRVVARERPAALVEMAGVAEMIVIVSVVHRCPPYAAALRQDWKSREYKRSCIAPSRSASGAVCARSSSRRSAHRQSTSSRSRESSRRSRWDSCVPARPRRTAAWSRPRAVSNRTNCCASSMATSSARSTAPKTGAKWHRRRASRAWSRRAAISDGKILAHASRKARPCNRLARFATSLARNASARASRRASDSGCSCAADARGKLEWPASQSASRMNRRRSGTSPCWNADSSPAEWTNPPVGSAESTSWRKIHGIVIVRLRRANTGGRAEASRKARTAIARRPRGPRTFPGRRRSWGARR